jgi:hypothetical protein
MMGKSSFLGERISNFLHPDYSNLFGFDMRREKQWAPQAAPVITIIKPSFRQFHSASTDYPTRGHSSPRNPSPPTIQPASAIVHGKSQDIGKQRVKITYTHSPYADDHQTVVRIHTLSVNDGAHNGKLFVRFDKFPNSFHP